jgi:hypothetical protein
MHKPLDYADFIKLVSLAGDRIVVAYFNDGDSNDLVK